MMDDLFARAPAKKQRKWTGLRHPLEPKELDIHRACADALDQLLMKPAELACYPAGHVQLSPAEVTRLSRVGLKRGWPDILILYEGLLFGIELKRRGGKLSTTRIGRTRKGSPRIYEGQVDVFPRLMAAGMTIAVVHSADEMLAKLRGWGLPLRGHQWEVRRAPEKVAAA
jgi:hypothetical protein